MTTPVTAKRIKIAKDFGLSNVDTIAKVCRQVGIPFYVACALFEKESMGKNVFGHDAGGALSGYPGPVTKDTYAVFRWMVIDEGHTSNGVGPGQITYAGAKLGNGKRSGGFFTQMEQRGLKPWLAEDNMFFSLERLLSYYKRSKSWVTAGQSYNGAREYGVDLAKKVDAWRKRLHV
jgi:hypothetical protein